MAPWLAAIVAVSLVSTASLLTVVMVPFMRQHTWLLSFLVATCIGTLLGDTMLHLMPEVFSEEQHLLRSLLVLLGLYGFSMVDRTVHGNHAATKLVFFSEATLVIGAAFTIQIQVGVGTAVAILLHEVPHTLGDFAVFISSGQSIWRALLLNFAACVPGYLGVVVALMLANSNEMRLCILALTAGNFLYIALVVLLPELSGQDDAEERPVGWKPRFSMRDCFVVSASWQR